MRHRIGVAIDDADRPERQAEQLGQDLAEHRLMPLAVVVAAQQQGGAAVGGDADLQPLPPAGCGAGRR